MGRTSRWIAMLCVLGSAACASDGILAPETAPEPGSAALEVKPAAASEGAAPDEKPAARPASAAATVTIRCGGSIPSSREPLYIVDGVPLGGPPDIQALDIQEIQVLKGATAAALYGSRAAHGIVIITTRAAHARRRA